ncbi:MAG TPA: MotA/TolQ/ExbB proton channel family protein [Gammaproteobacteria bacterium]|nr:MotA/TolQ/ExbB proton channel family protein [Gammaproteobacteria bacterium]
MSRAIPLLLALLPLLAQAQTPPAPRSLDELLQMVLQQHNAQRQEDAEREQSFLKQRDQQQALLEQAKAALAAEEARGTALKAAYDKNEQAIAQQREALKTAMGELGELQGVVRQVAGDIKSLLDGSLVSAQFPGRDELPAKLARSEELPTIEEIEKLWQLLLQEIVESGKVVRFKAKVIGVNGKEEERTVTRIGVFNATEDGHFLRYANDIQRLVAPVEQPESIYQHMARNLEQSKEGLTAVAFDPTRGAMLALLAQAPSFWQRIQQGRAIGMFTIGLGLLALVIAAQRFVVLSRIQRGIDRQLKNPRPNPDNPLGRVMKVYFDHQKLDVEALGLQLEEAILRELPALQRGLGALVIIAEASPLLGLLGTVSGMISTFQALSLFGAGDAKVVAGGISEALVTTVIGMSVAIPCLLIHSVLRGRSEQLIQVLDEQSAGIVARVAEQGRG